MKNSKAACITIITVVYNGKKYLEETIRSVINQTYDNIEYIIIDGGSTDGTVDIIKKYEERVDYWVSEKDNGIYDAMNKGIQLFQGDYIWFINAGDLLFDPTTIESLMSRYQNVDVIYGDTQLIDTSGELKKLVKAPKTLSWETFANGMVVSHQSILIHRDLVQKYNLEYRYIADHDWIIQALKNTTKIIYAEQPLSKYLLDGFSQHNFMGCWNDRFKIIEKYYGRNKLILNYYYFFIAYVKYTVKKILGIL